MSEQQLCAREGCGAPKAWHTFQTPLRELVQDLDERKSGKGLASHRFISTYRQEGECIGSGCKCRGFLAPEPPKRVYVVELTDNDWHHLRNDSAIARGTMAISRLRGAIPLAEYLASHPQPAPRRCVCGGREDEHDSVTGLCSGFCNCPQFREAQP